MTNKAALSTKKSCNSKSVDFFPKRTLLSFNKNPKKSLPLIFGPVQCIMRIIEEGFIQKTRQTGIFGLNVQYSIVYIAVGFMVGLGRGWLKPVVVLSHRLITANGHGSLRSYRPSVVPCHGHLSPTC